MRRLLQSTGALAARCALVRYVSANAVAEPKTVAEEPIATATATKHKKQDDTKNTTTSTSGKNAFAAVVLSLSEVALKLQSHTNSATTPEKISTLPVPPEQLIRSLGDYISRESQLDILCRSKNPAARRHHALLRKRLPVLGAAQRDVLLHTACGVVERREVSIYLATRLLRPRWPERHMDLAGIRHHAFLVRSVRAWISAQLKQPGLEPIDVRRILTQSPHIFTGQVSLLGAVAEAAVADISNVTDAEPLIQLLWAVHTAGTHAPDHFWRRIVARLAQLNRSLRDHVASNDAKKVTAGHVFSGLTTRQLFRVLRVLRRERWCGESSTLFDFADRALKNIVFEVESHSTASAELRGSRQAVSRRIAQVSGLTPGELLSLLHIANEIGVEAPGAMTRVSDELLAPLAPHLRREQLLVLTACVRHAQCDSPRLLQAVVDTVLARGGRYPCALGLAKAALRGVLQKPAMLSQLTLGPFLTHVFTLCEDYCRSMRGSQLLGWVELLYGLSRRYAPGSSIGTRIRSSVDRIAAQLVVMSELHVVPDTVLARMLEHTVILGMRKQPQFPATAQLHALYVANNKHENNTRKDNDTDEKRKSAEQSHETNSVQLSPDGRTRAACQVYNELIYAYERQMILRLPLSRPEEVRFRDTISHVGLFNLFAGASLMARAHFHRTEGAANGAGPNAISAWTERCVGAAIESRVRSARMPEAGNEESLLWVLGQQRCDVAKVRQFLQLVQDSPLLLARQQRSLAEFACKLAERFGSVEEQTTAKRMLEKAIY